MYVRMYAWCLYICVYVLCVCVFVTLHQPCKIGGPFLTLKSALFGWEGGGSESENAGCASPGLVSFVCGLEMPARLSVAWRLSSPPRLSDHSPGYRKAFGTDTKNSFRVVPGSVHCTVRSLLSVILRMQLLATTPCIVEKKCLQRIGTVPRYLATTQVVRHKCRRA